MSCNSAGALGLLFVQPQLRGHDAAKEGHFKRVMQHVLGETGAVLELPEQFDQFGMDAVHAHVEGGLFADLAQLDVKLLLDLLDDVLDARGMDAARHG